MRITQSTVDSMFVGTVQAAALVGVDSSGWSLYHDGFYRIVTIDPVGQGHRTVVSCIGLNKREAYLYLSAMREAFWLAHRTGN